MTRPTEKDGEKKRLSISALARETGLDRATVTRRLEKVKPVEARPKQKLYDADEALEALKGDDRSGLRKAQTMKTAVEASRAKLKLERERGEVVPISEVREDLQRIIKRLYQHFVVNGPRDLAQRLRTMKTTGYEAAIKDDAEQFFNELRAEYESYL